MKNHQLKQGKTISGSALALVLLLTIVACSPEEGLGGNAQIRGRIVKKIYNDDKSLLLATESAKDEDVFLLFGEEQTVGEKVETSYTGHFQFGYLWPGDYRLFYYSDTPNATHGDQVEIVHEISLKRGEEVDLQELEIVKLLDFDDGHAQISGRVFKVNYYNFSQWPNLIVKDTSRAQEQEVYLTYGNHSQYDERIRTNADGTFTFKNLIKGTYTIHLFSEDPKGATEDVVISKTVEINQTETSTDLGDLYIYNL
ncbi:collagen binding domain-containing protein [Marinoscillum furvescens]|uniref:Polysaccharide lyase family 4-like protein n=1 Tax=Marinoscillum furvescens DSM 4134 TaxID=1122208 RepID=A0A3D9L304_MARFU|nr:hypothetical protein [Marinoscillum furvescens]RED98374.1 polysaccharide lyase family 4-like protein [Marinoscillum furvescens DSM 4134]